MLTTYEIGDKLGRGTVGTVYRAVHRPTGKIVALKTLSAPGSGPAMSLASEIRAMVRLNHPHVLYLLDHGIAGEEDPVTTGSAWMATEFASGGGLEVWSPNNWEEASAHWRAVLEGLRHAHSRGFVHRDLKPGNLLWCTADDLRPGLKIADFGLAWAVGVDKSGFRRCGTPSYMAPEQVRGAIRDLGPWTDLYALGCVVWQWLTGVPPFGWGQVEAVLHAQVRQEVPSLKAAIAVPDGVEDLLRSMLDKRIDRRPGNASVILATLDVLVGAVMGGSGRSEVALPDSVDTMHETAQTHEVPRSSRPSNRVRLPGAWHDTEMAESALIAGMGLQLVGERDLRLVGRLKERDALWRTLTAAARSPKVRVVALTANQGLGTSTLARWILERTSALGAAEAHRCAADTGLKGLVQRAFGWVGERTEVIPTAAHDSPLVKELLNSPLTPAAVAAWLIERAQAGLLVLWADDAPSDPDLVELIRSLLFAGSAVPLVVLATGRRRADFWKECDTAPGFERMELTPLPDREIVEICERDLGLEITLAWRLAESVAGNPAVLLDWVDHLARTGALLGSKKGVRLKDGKLPSAPSRRESRAEKALDSLGPARRRQVALGALLGHEVTWEAWRTLNLVLGLEADDAGLRELVSQDLVSPTADGFRFEDPRTRLALVNELEEEDAPGFHLAAAVAHTRLPKTVENDVKRGHHLIACGQVQRGRDVLFAAMTVLQSERRFAEMATALRTALAGGSIEGLPPEHHLAALYFQLDQTRHVNSYESIIPMARATIAAAEAHPEHPQAPNAMSLAAEMLLNHESLDEGITVLRRCDLTQSRNIRLLGLGHLMAGNGAHAEHFLKLAIEKTEIPHERATAANGLGMLAGGRGEYDKAIAWFELAADDVDPNQRHAIWSNMAIVRILQRDFDRAIALGLKATHLASQGPARARAYLFFILALAASGARDDARLRLCREKARFYLSRFDHKYLGSTRDCLAAIGTETTALGAEFLAEVRDAIT